ncbi:multicopper oxidase domain-containing protein [Actinomadura chibensis]|uniref:Multicopper oxidase domain-containing protein n=2 Tax=Actinomadura chibensis TaxID=392828 RepID=A0A5D0NJ10_9ACTN|nr:multicopper oxidase domain-containing protein [Actinomadura chibensis]
MYTRRHVLKVGAAVGGALALFPSRTSWAALRGASPLDPATIPKYVSPLLVPPAMPPVGHGRGITEYRIGIRQFRQQVLPSGLPTTTVWGYGSTSDHATFSYPGWTINARVDHPVRVTWINQLVDRRGAFLPSMLAVDPTLHWANPPGGISGRDSAPTFTSTPGPYRGPVPTVTHLHGGHDTEDSDGYPEAWYLPAATNIPPDFARVGSYYDRFREEFAERHGVRWRPGSATFQYDNDQRATTLWYHDHALGITRLNVYSGLAGFYLLSGGPSDLPPGVLPEPAPAVGDPPGTRYYDIPIVIQDRSFNTDGSLFYPASRAFFGAPDGYTGPYIPTTDVPPIWNPEFFGNTIVANGRTWPVFNVEQRRYRLRFLNGSNSRFLILKIAANPTARPARAALPIWQIGSDGGFLPTPIRSDQVQVAPANRIDSIVDFTNEPVGTELWLINEGPDSPFHGDATKPPADPSTTGQVLKFVVGPRVGTDKSVPPDQLRLPPFPRLGPASNTRRLLLTEEMSTIQNPNASPTRTLLGTVTADGVPEPRMWGDPVTELPLLGSTEIWELHNKTEGAHPIHLHQVQFQVVGRGPDGTSPPGASDTGYLDTVTALPGQITRVKAHFDIPGRFVWHCHMIEHEDNEMMRPYQVIKPKGK